MISRFNFQLGELGELRQQKINKVLGKLMELSYKFHGINRKILKKLFVFVVILISGSVYTMTDVFSANSTIYPTIVKDTIQNNSDSNLRSNDSSKDLSPLFDKDKVSENIRVVRNGLVDLLKQGVESIPTQDNETANKTVTLNNTKNIKSDSTTVISNSTTGVDSFQDISKDANKKYINLLAENKIIFKNKKFYPGNDTKLFDFVKILVNSYRYKLGYDLATDVGFTTENDFSFSGFDEKCYKIINTAFKLGILKDLDVGGTGKNLKFNSPINSKIISQILLNFVEEYPSLVDEDYIKSISKDTFIVNRSNVAKYIVLGLKMDMESKIENTNIVTTSNNVSQNNYYFDDTKTSKYGKDVEVLGKLGIVSNQSRNFGIDKYATRQDFIIMFIKSYLLKNNKSIEPNSYLQTSINDIVNDKNAVYVVYGEKNKLIDFLFEAKRGQNYLYPNKLLTKHEAYNIIKENLGINIIYPVEEADKQNISRGELAELLVNSFQFGSDNNLEKGEINNVDNNNSILVSLGKLFLNKL